MSSERVIKAVHFISAWSHGDISVLLRNYFGNMTLGRIAIIFCILLISNIIVAHVCIVFVVAAAIWLEVS